jgi:hypothetical protein
MEYRDYIERNLELADTILAAATEMRMNVVKQAREGSARVARSSFSALPGGRAALRAEAGEQAGEQVGIGLEHQADYLEA